MIKDKSILIKNIYYMLTYAFTVLNQSNYEDIATEDFDNIHNLFAAILGKGIGQQLKQGLYLDYQNHQENLETIRGKIDIHGTIMNKIAKKQAIACDYDELSENNNLNQILKTTVLLLLKHKNVDAKYKDDLKKKMLFFSSVATQEPATIKWSFIRFYRNNHTYRMLINICRLVIEGMLLTTEHGEHKLAAFLSEQFMHNLYEKFILEYYRAEYPKIRANASQISWAVDDGIRTMLPVMQSDITLSYGEKVLIIDAKYYTRIIQTQHDAHTIRSNHLYQIFTYVKNKDREFGSIPHTVSGMLLYARTEDSFRPDNTYYMSGNKISVQTLDLNTDFSHIKTQLNAIIEEHFGDILSISA